MSEELKSKTQKGITIEISGDTAKLNEALDQATVKADLLIEKLEKAKELANQINEED